MTSFSDGREPVSCAEVRSLFDKTLLEEVLSPEEQRRVDNHLSQCPRCKRLFALASALPLFVDKTDGRFEAGIAAVMEDWHRRREEKQHPKNRWKSVAIASAIATLAVVGVWNLRGVLHSSVVPSPELPCVPSARIEAASGVFMAYCDSDEPMVSVNADETRVLLRRGFAALLVEPERPGKKNVIVETAFGEVRVKGTLFAVHVEEDNAWVEVIQGSVEVVPKKKEGVAFQVAAGNGSELTQRALFNVSESVEDMFIQMLVKPSDTLDETPNETISAQRIALDSSEAKGKDSAEVETDPIDNSDLIEKEIHNRFRDSSTRHTALSVQTLIEEARACLLIRDWACAASRYQETLRISPKRQGLTTVLISLAKIELRHLNRPKKALIHYKTYLQQAPNGPLAEEAFFGMANSYRRLGLKEREEETLRRFIERYPKSNLAGKVRDRISQLREADSM